MTEEVFIVAQLINQLMESNKSKREVSLYSESSVLKILHDPNRSKLFKTAEMQEST